VFKIGGLSPDISVLPSANKTDHHHITEQLLRMAKNSKPKKKKKKPNKPTNKYRKMGNIS
jgi:hypothetical protein